MSDNALIKKAFEFLSPGHWIAITLICAMLVIGLAQKVKAEDATVLSMPQYSTTALIEVDEPVVEDVTAEQEGLWSRLKAWVQSKAKESKEKDALLEEDIVLPLPSALLQSDELPTLIPLTEAEVVEEKKIDTVNIPNVVSVPDVSSVGSVLPAPKIDEVLSEEQELANMIASLQAKKDLLAKKPHTLSNK